MITFLAKGIMKRKVVRQEKAQSIPRTERIFEVYRNWLNID